jgi:hypothetical protein
LKYKEKMVTRKIQFFILFVVMLNRPVLAQVTEMAGSSICSDGNNSTAISIIHTVPEKFYSLYKDGQLLQMRQSAVKTQENSILFGNFSEPGIYTTAVFDKVVAGFPMSSGTPAKGSIVISQAPVVLPMDSLILNSGEKVNFLPKADTPGSSFSWTSRVQYGKPRGQSKKGTDAIRDVLFADGGTRASVIYSITPYITRQGLLCTGRSRDLVVIINP